MVGWATWYDYISNITKLGLKSATLSLQVWELIVLFIIYPGIFGLIVYIAVSKNQAINKGASFYIEGLEPQDTSFAGIKVEQDTQVYCKICNKLMGLKSGEVIPMCCGKMMTIVD